MNFISSSCRAYKFSEDGIKYPVGDTSIQLSFLLYATNILVQMHSLIRRRDAEDRIIVRHVDTLKDIRYVQKVGIRSSTQLQLLLDINCASLTYENTQSVSMYAPGFLINSEIS